jgi:tRNA(Ser,Leu) C12 N-acetylase TAN1
MATAPDPPPEHPADPGRPRGAPPEWNVVVSVREDGYGRAFGTLRQFGRVSRTGFRNVLALTVSDTGEFLKAFSDLVAQEPDILYSISRAVPAAATFDFHTSEEFEEKARDVALAWVGQLAGKSFHVRLHRRGLKGRIASRDEEVFLDRVLLDALEKAGTPGSITFEDPDVILDIETLGTWAAMSVWTREDLKRYPFLRVD